MKQNLLRASACCPREDNSSGIADPQFESLGGNRAYDSSSFCPRGDRQGRLDLVFAMEHQVVRQGQTNSRDL